MTGTGRKLFRTVRLPENLPPWFKDYDTETDGQVALYQWKDKYGTVEDFRKLDLNEDGFITVEELIRSGHFATSTGNAPPTVGGLRPRSASSTTSR